MGIHRSIERRGWIAHSASEVNNGAVNVRHEEFNSNCLNSRSKHARVRVKPVERRHLAEDQSANVFPRSVGSTLPRV